MIDYAFLNLRFSTIELSTEVLLNTGDFVCVMLRSDRQEGTHKTAGQTGEHDQSNMTIRFIG